MESTIMQSTVQLNEETKQQLTAEVKETVANQYTRHKKRNFTASEMWNAQRKRRSASAMMRKWNLN